jgi:hypothetical protein
MAGRPVSATMSGSNPVVVTLTREALQRHDADHGASAQYRGRAYSDSSTGSTNDGIIEICCNRPSRNKVALTLLAIAVILGTVAVLGHFGVIPMSERIVYILAGSAAVILVLAAARKCNTLCNSPRYLSLPLPLL